MRLVAAGHGNRAIAQQLCLTERAVEDHLRKAFDRLGARSRTEAVHLARRSGWAL